MPGRGDFIHNLLILPFLDSTVMGKGIIVRDMKQEGKKKKPKKGNKKGKTIGNNDQTDDFG